MPACRGRVHPGVDQTVVVVLCARVGGRRSFDGGSRRGRGQTRSVGPTLRAASRGTRSRRSSKRRPSGRSSRSQSRSACSGGSSRCGLLIAGQVIGRQLRRDADDLDVLRALGASPAMTTSDGLVGVFGAVVVGSLLAVAVAIGLSPLAPLGPARPVDPSPGVALDGTVLGLGVLVLIIASSAIAFVIAYRRAPHRVAHRRNGPRTAGRASRVRPRHAAYPRRRSQASASPSNPARATTRCRCVQRSSAPHWRSSWSPAPSRSAPASTTSCHIPRSTGGTGPTSSAPVRATETSPNTR